MDEILNLIESVSEDFPSYFSIGKVKIMYYFETIAAIVLRVGLTMQINVLMKLNEYHRSSSLFDLGPRSLRFQN